MPKEKVWLIFIVFDIIGISTLMNFESSVSNHNLTEENVSVTK